MQKTLSTEQVSAFYHDSFVQQQVDHFSEIALPSLTNGTVVVDVGGGCGFFSSAVSRELNIPTRVIDMDHASVEYAKQLGVDAVVGDALRPEINDDEGIVCFNLILHHLVGNTEKETFELQKRALAVWMNKDCKVFVNEYIYESWFRGFSGWIIYQITKSELLSSIGKVVSKIFPSLKANTFGVGVRFRSNQEWKDLFDKTGFVIVNEIEGGKEYISLPRRLLFIKEIRRDSFLLVSK